MVLAKIGFVGAGQMAQALIGGLLQEGIRPETLYLFSRTPERRERVAARFGITPLPSVGKLILRCETVVLAVKPQQLREAVAPIASLEETPRRLLISVAAGIPTETLQRWLGAPAIVRAMPNTPVRVGCGVTGLYATPAVLPEQKQLAAKLFGSVGEVVWVDREPLLDVVTALSGSGPAYLFYLMEALEEVGRELGLDREVAHLLVSRTVLGSGKLATLEGKPPEQLRREVTSPGGTTERALSRLEAGRWKALLQEAVRAAHQRAKELARTLSESD